MKSLTSDTANIHIFLISAFILMLYYNYYYNSVARVRVIDTKFRLYSPYQNENNIETNDAYEKLIDIKNFTFITNPQPCEEYPAGFLLLIIVTSNPSHYEYRQVIRETWGKAVDSTRTVFLLGEIENSANIERIQQESKEYGDIVQGSFIDAYRNMTYKHVMGLKWVAHHCPMAKYILKTDDDVVLNSREMRRYLAKELSPWGAQGLIRCQVLDHTQPFRNNSKWKVTMDEYADDYYPRYCAGWAILYSQDVITYLLDAAQTAPYFWIDDVHITGVLAQKLSIARASLGSLILSRSQADELLKAEKNPVGTFLLGPPNMSVQNMKIMWKLL